MLPYPWELGVITQRTNPLAKYTHVHTHLISTIRWDATGEGIY